MFKKILWFFAAGMLLLFLSVNSVLAGTVPPVWESNFGALIPGGAQSDDSVSDISLGFMFPFFGQNYTSATVSSNGFVQFGGSDSARCCNADSSTFVAGYPTIAGAWFDLYPPGNTNGGVYLNTSTANRAVITWNAVPEYGQSQTAPYESTFQIQLYSTGEVILAYDQFSVPGTVNGHIALIGLTPGGGGADPGSTDLLGATYPMSPSGTVYQLFPNQNNTPTAAAAAGAVADGLDLTFFTTAPSSVPEPSTLVLFGLGTMALVAFRRRARC
jgi:hypothetical protein